MYLAGNGFYWVTTVDSERGHAIEVRRGFAGVLSGARTLGQRSAARRSSSRSPAVSMPTDSRIRSAGTSSGEPDTDK